MQGTQRDGILDGLRGAAALAVVYYHYVQMTGISDRPGSGYLGVQVFFVLSGYLITRGVWRSGNGTTLTTYRHFLKRRVQRLYPALLGVLAIGGPITAYVGPETMAETALAGLVAAFQLTAFAHATGSIPLETWGHTWSLTVEWVFYVLWPIAVVAFHVRGVSAALARRITWLLAVVLYTGSLWLSADAFYLLPVGNLAVMLVGAALALGHARSGDARPAGRDPGVANLALLLLLVLVFFPAAASGQWFYRVSMLPAAVVAAYIIIDHKRGTDSLVRRLLESRVIAGLGVTSYSLYLWHTPVLRIVWGALPDLSSVARAGIALVALVPVTYVSYRFLERPWLGHADRRSPRAEDGLAPVRTSASAV